MIALGSEAEVLPAGRLQGEGGDGVDVPHTPAEDCPAGGRQVGMTLPILIVIQSAFGKCQKIPHTDSFLAGRSGSGR